MKIKVKGSNLEMLEIEVDEAYVERMYEHTCKVEEEVKQLTKTISDRESSLRYAREDLDIKNSQIREANVLLTMLGVAEKDNNEESYSRTTLSVSTRIALYIAGKLNV